MAADWVTMISADPFIIAVSISPKRYTHKLITRYKEFVVSVPLIKEAVANLECKVIGMHDYGDHTLFIGEVVAYSYNDKVFPDDEPKPGSGFILHIAKDKFTVEESSVVKPR